MANKKGRPFAVKNKREQLTVALTLADGCVARLLKRYNTTQKATAIRNALHELLEIEESTSNKIDTNSSRQRKKEIAMEMGLTVSNLNIYMDKHNCNVAEIEVAREFKVTIEKLHEVMEENKCGLHEINGSLF